MKRKTNWSWIVAIVCVLVAMPQVLFFWLSPPVQAKWAVYIGGTAITAGIAAVICWTVTKYGIRKSAAPTIAGIVLHIITVLISAWLLAIDSPLRGVVCMFLFGPGFASIAILSPLVSDAASGPQPRIVHLSARAEPKPVGPEDELIPIEPPVMPNFSDFDDPDFAPDHEPDFSDFGMDDSTPPLPPRY